MDKAQLLLIIASEIFARLWRTCGIGTLPPPPKKYPKSDILWKCTGGIALPGKKSKIFSTIADFLRNCYLPRKKTHPKSFARLQRSLPR